MLVSFAILTFGQLVPLPGGVTNLSEVYALASMAVLLTMRHSRIVAEEAILLFSTLGLLSVLVAHDFVLGGVTNETIKVAAHYLVILAYVFLLRRSFVAQPQRVVLFTLFLALSALLALLSGLTTDRSESDPWQLALAGPTALLVFSFVAYASRARKTWLIGALVFLAMLHIAFAARALALGTVVTMALLWLWNRKRRASASLMAARLIVIGSIVGVVAAIGIDAAMRNDVFGKELGDQYVAQSSNKYGLIGGSRPQLLVGAIAGFDRPIFGYGTYQSAVAPYYVHMLVLEIQNSPIVNERFVERKIDSGRIPGHSTIIDSWHIFGVLGLIFWIWVMILIAKTLFKAMATPGTESSVMIFLAPQLLWAIVFNPGPPRLMFSVGFAFVLAFLVRAASPQGPEARSQRRHTPQAHGQPASGSGKSYSS